MDAKYKKLEWTDENVKRFWDFEAQFDERYFTYRVGDTLVKRLAKYFPLAGRALDYGSGHGHLVKPLLNYNLEVSTLEFSRRAINFIKEKYQNFPGFAGAYSNIEIDQINKEFDIIFLVEIFEHLNDIELENTINNVKKLLKKEGVAVITAPNDERLDESMVSCPECQNIFHRWQHVRSWNEESLEKYLKERGFIVLEINAVDLNYENEKENFNTRQRIYSWLFKKDRKWIYKPHLISVIRKK